MITKQFYPRISFNEHSSFLNLSQIKRLDLENNTFKPIQKKNKKTEDLPAYYADLCITLEIPKEMSDITFQQHRPYHMSNNVTPPIELKVYVIVQFLLNTTIINLRNERQEQLTTNVSSTYP